MIHIEPSGSHGMDIRFSACLTLLALSGCSITKFGDTFEGANDFRIIPAFGPEIAAPKDCVQKVPVTHASGSDASRVAVSLGCYSRFQMHPEVNSSSPSYLVPKESIAIYLKSMYFSFFTEGWAEIWSNRLAGSPVKGEIAIVANVGQGAQSPGGLNGQGELEGRVVFFGNDVYQPQLANEFNVPLFGPEVWSGGPLTLNLWILELDEAESQQFGPILKTLSGLSAKLIGMGGSGEEVLNQIGSAFLNANTDDVIGHLAVTLVPPQPGAGVTDPILQVSDIIIQRSESFSYRGGGISFDKCFYEPLQAKVYCPSGEEAKIPDRNSFVLAIRRATNTPSLVSDISLSQLNERLANASSFEAINAIIEENAELSASRAAAQDAQQAITRMADRATPGAVREFDANQVLIVLQCALLARKLESAAPAEMTSWQNSLQTSCNTSSPARSISMDDFNLLGRKMVEVLSFDVVSLSPVSLIGDTVGPSDTVLRSLRAALISKGVPRTQTPD